MYKIPIGYRIVKKDEYNMTGDLYITCSCFDTADINNYCLSSRTTEMKAITEYDNNMFYIRKITHTPRGNKPYVHTNRI